MRALGSGCSATMPPVPATSGRGIACRHADRPSWPWRAAATTCRPTSSMAASGSASSSWKWST
eukprot:7384015-Prymnesium_polylepis.1